MARRLKTIDRVTIALRLADSALLPLTASPDCLCFLGRYSRLAAFGPPGARLDAYVVAHG